VGGSQSSWREHTHAQGEHANSTQKGPSCCEVMVLTTTPPCATFWTILHTQMERPVKNISENSIQGEDFWKFGDFPIVESLSLDNLENKPYIHSNAL